jgi:hypothetical protein
LDKPPAGPQSSLYFAQLCTRYQIRFLCCSSAQTAISLDRLRIKNRAVFKATCMLRPKVLSASGTDCWRGFTGGSGRLLLPWGPKLDFTARGMLLACCCKSSSLQKLASVSVAADTSDFPRAASRESAPETPETCKDGRTPGFQIPDFPCDFAPSSKIQSFRPTAGEPRYTLTSARLHSL